MFIREEGVESFHDILQSIKHKQMQDAPEMVEEQEEFKFNYASLPSKPRRLLFTELNSRRRNSPTSSKRLERNIEKVI
jgi:hypothetical protein